MKSLPLHIEVFKHEGCLSYLLADPVTQEALLVDPKLEDAGKYLQALEGYGYTLGGVFDTHGHADHVTAAPALVEKTGTKVYRHKLAEAPCVTNSLDDGGAIPLGRHQLKVMHTPGHTPDHLVLLAPGAVFTGDSLLLKTCGRTDFPGGDAKAQWATLQKLAALPDDTVVYPGHDYRGLKFMTLAEVKQVNERLALNSEAEFEEVMANLALGTPKKLQESLAAARHCTWKEYAEQHGITLEAE